jgi:prolipoprotein diacylglyceryltransferase
MEKHLLMNISNGGLLFQLFYVLAFLTAYAILIYEGYRRKFPLIAWILVLACIQLFFVVGTKIFSFSSEEWRFMFQNHTLLPNAQKTLFGGILLGIVGYLIARHFLKFRYFVLDAFAVAFPVAVSIQTIGCFFYGCCFGKPSSIPWAVQYPVMTLPHYHQFESGLLTYNDLHSLPVHPVQLYLMLGGILVVCLVIRFRRYWKAQGSILLSSAILFITMSFVIEFFRDPLSSRTGGEMLWILKQVQWQYMVLAFLMTLLLLWREKTYKVKSVVSSNDLPPLSKQIAFLLSIVLIFLMLHNWFTLPEIIALNIALLPAVFFIGVEIYRTFASLRYRWVFACSILLPLFLMSHTLPQTQTDSTIVKKNNTYHTVGFGLATGNYTDRGTYSTSQSSCGSSVDEHYFSQKYTAGGAGYSMTRETPDTKKVTRYGINVFLGDYKQFSQADSQQVRNFLFGINPFFKYDIEWIGVGVGLHLGNLVYTAGDKDKEDSKIPKKNYLEMPVFPQFYFRIGPMKYFYIDFHLADQFPVSFPGLAFQTGVGTGLGLDNGTSIRLGFSFLDKAGYYLSAYLPTKYQIVLEPMFLWTSDAEKRSYPGFLPEQQVSLGISYRFGHK